MFRNREEAGELIAKDLKTRDFSPDLVVAIPKGGVPVGKQISKEIEAPLDIVTAAPLRVPEKPEQDIGAVSADGTLWLQDRAADIDIPEEYIEKMRLDKTSEALQQYENYRGKGEIPALTGKKVLVVADVVKEISSLMAALGTVKKSGPRKIAVAAPAAGEKSARRIENVADETCIIKRNESITSISGFYGVSESISEEKLKNILLSS